MFFCFHLFLKMYCTTEFCCLDNFNTQYELSKVWRERERKKEGERKRERKTSLPYACEMGSFVLYRMMIIQIF